MRDGDAPVNPAHDEAFARFKDLARHSLTYGLFDVLGRLGAVVLVPLYTRVLGVAEFGFLELYLVTQVLLVLVFGLGFPSALTKYYVLAGSADEERTVFRNALGSVLLVCLAALALFVPLAPRLSARLFGEAGDPSLLVLVLLAAATEVVALVFLTLFRAREQPGAYGAVNLSRLLLALSVTVWLVGFREWGIRGVLVGSLAGSSLAVVTGAIMSRSLLGVSLDRAIVFRLLGFGFPLALSGLALFVLSSSDRYFLRAFSEPAELGVYALAYKVAVLMSLALNAFLLAWPPMLFRIAPLPDAPRILSRVPTYFLMAYLPILVGLAALAPEIVGVAGTTDFSRAAPLVGLVAASHLLGVLFNLFCMGAVLTERTYLVPLVTFLAAAANLVLNRVLIPPLGAWGAAWATLGSYLLLAVAGYLVNQHFYRAPLEAWRVVRIVLVAGGTLVLARLLPLEPGWGALLAKGVLVLVLFPLGYVGLRILDPEERFRIRRLLLRRFGRT